MGLPDANRTQTEMILDQAWDTWSAKQGKRVASVPAWASLVISIGFGVFIAGSLSRDVALGAEANTSQELRIRALERELGEVNGKLDSLIKLQESGK